MCIVHDIQYCNLLGDIYLYECPGSSVPRPTYNPPPPPNSHRHAVVHCTNYLHFQCGSGMYW
jgi:hypothetical protein